MTERTIVLCNSSFESKPVWEKGAWNLATRQNSCHTDEQTTNQVKCVLYSYWYQYESWGNTCMTAMELNSANSFSRHALFFALGGIWACGKTKRLMEDRCIDRRTVFSHLKCCFYILEDRIIEQLQCLWIIYREVKLRPSNQWTELILWVFKEVIQYKENKNLDTFKLK